MNHQDRFPSFGGIHHSESFQKKTPFPKDSRPRKNPASVGDLRRFTRIVGTGGIIEPKGATVAAHSHRLHEALPPRHNLAESLRMPNLAGGELGESCFPPLAAPTPPNPLQLMAEMELIWLILAPMAHESRKNMEKCRSVNMTHKAPVS